jgi:site-specific recombinase XerD
MTERGSPMSAAGFRKMLSRTGKEAGFRYGVHPHMLRHACGFKLANDGQDTRALQHYLGHKNIQHTVRYTGGSRTFGIKGMRGARVAVVVLVFPCCPTGKT